MEQLIKNFFFLLAGLLLFSPCWADQIDQLIALSKKAPPVQYETIVTAYVVATKEPIPGPASSKIWQKNEYRKIADTTNTPIFITRPDGTYMYDARKDQWTKRTKPDVPAENVFDLMRKDKNSKLTVVGDEVVDGKECTVVSKVAVVNGESATSKVWVWKNNGLPIRSEATMKWGSDIVTARTDYKNFVFGDIPDSVFAVPKEKVVQKTE